MKKEVEGINLRLAQARDQREQHHHEKITRNLKDQQRKCHQVFKVVNYSEQKDINPMPAEGTCEWALNSSEYLRWTASDRNELLWVSADPGCGKSVLARLIIDNYLRKSIPAVTVCYFFFKDNESQNNLAAALCSLLHQLFSQRPELLHHALPSWEMNGQALQNEPNELWQIFIAATSSDVPVHTICILDALDECCDIDQNRLTQNLKSFYHACQPTQVSQSSCLKFLVTSRPYNQIRNHFRSLENFLYLHLKGEEENDQIHREIDLVVKVRTKELAEAASLSWESQQRLEQQLLRMEHRTYLWLHLAFDDIRSTFENSLWPAEESIRMIPSSVDKAYEKILSRVPSGQLSTVKKIFQIIIAAREPLTTSQLAMALGISIRPGSRSAAEAMIDPVDFDGKLRNLCGLFVFVNNSKVYLIHQTAREYLMKGLAASHSLSCSLQGAEEQMAHICLQYLSMKEFDSTDPEEYIGFADLLEYAAFYWAKHVCLMSSAAELEVKDLLDLVYDTKTNRFLLWFSELWRALHGPDEPVPTMTPMHIAVLNGHQNVVTRLLDKGRLMLSVADSTGSYPLTYASFMGHYEISELIIAFGGDVNSQGGLYGSPLLAACYIEANDIVRMLLRCGANVNAVPGDHNSAIFNACFHGYDEIVQMLLEYGADPNPESSDGSHLLGKLLLGIKPNIMHMLLMYGADPNCCDGSSSILQVACIHDLEEIVQMLLDFGADVSAEDENGIDILKTAYLRGNDRIFHMLLKHVSNVNQISGAQAALRSASRGNRETVVQMLFDSGLEIDDQNYQGALNEACLKGHDNIVKILLEHGNPKPNHCKRVLELACLERYDKIVQALLEHQYVKPADCTEVLGFACFRGYNEIVHVLLGHGVTVNGRNGYCGHSEIHFAWKGGHWKIAKMLLEHGAGTCDDCRTWIMLLSLLYALWLVIVFSLWVEMSL